MPAVLSASDVFEQIRTAAVAATGPDERALQIDYDQLKHNVQRALGDRKVALIHANTFLPEGYEEQGRFNVLLLTQGKVLYDIVIGDSYFRCDVFSAADLDKIQLIDGM